MKTKVSFLLLPFCFCLFTSTLLAQYTIPSASQQPAWVFPVWFEDGTGQKDTIYIGYDPDAGNSYNIDPKYGEYWIIQDTTKPKFNAYVYSYGGVDSIVKVQVETGLNTSIGLLNVTWPVIMKFDIDLFYSDSLPDYLGSTNYPDTIPKAYGELWCSDADPAYNNCVNNYPSFFLTDDPLSYFSWNTCTFTPPVTLPYVGPAICKANDSIVFYRDTSTVYNIAGIGDLLFEPYASWTGVDEQGLQNLAFSVYPNPFSQRLHLQSKTFLDFEYSVYNIFGKQVVPPQNAQGKNAVIDTGKLTGGLYILKIKTGDQVYIKKVIKASNF